jgi:DNA-binding transcriptional MerR regulator
LSNKKKDSGKYQGAIHMLCSLQTEPALGLSPSIAISPKSYTIRELAREFGLTLRALRFYEDRGLITPRREGSVRIYSSRERARLSVIVKAKALGFTLSEIKETLAAEGRSGGPHGLSISQKQVEDQIAHLQQQRAEIEAALAHLSVLRAQFGNAPRAL